MTKRFTLIILLFSALSLHGQRPDTTNFELFNLQLDTFLNGSDLSGKFDAGAVVLPNSFNTEWSSWSGWSISTMRDDTTAGFTNQYSSITAGGANGSDTYAVSFKGGTNSMSLPLNGQVDHDLNGMYVTNSTYAYLSMKNGDSFAKKFGGETGTDPDFFLLSITANNSTDTVKFYLADYRSDDSTKDYIVDEWKFVDLSTFNDADSLFFSLSSSDNGSFGMNTPAYFCIDDVLTDILLSSNDINTVARLFPNPTVEYLNIEVEISNGHYAIYNNQGEVVLQNAFNTIDRIDVSQLPTGMYVLDIVGEEKRAAQQFIKN